MQVLILIVLFILGAIFGSFACCQAWRWRYKIEKKKKLGKWSVCIHCGHRIKWYDNIPIISWLVLRGKCRHCGKKIGIAEFLSELGLGVGFVAMGHAYLTTIVTFWDTLVMDPIAIWLRLAIFVITLAMLVVLTILSVYDAKWGELPVVLLRVALGFGVVILESGVIISLHR